MSDQPQTLPAPSSHRRQRLVANRLSRALATLGAAAGVGLAGPALSSERFPVTPDQRATAERVASSGVALSDLAPNAPDSHTVVPGDTLWGISKLFLQSPWRWPELWGMNKDQVRDPHLIYPGQVLVLERGADGRARLRVAGSGDAAGSEGSSGSGGTVKLSPRVRVEPLTRAPIPTIPINAIAPFLSRSTVIEPGQLEAAPTLVAGVDGRRLLSSGDRAYVRGDVSTQRVWQVYRGSRALVDPATGETLAYETRGVGAAEVLAENDSELQRVLLSGPGIETQIGDRLAPAPVVDLSPFTPRAPQKPINGRIVAIHGDGELAAQHQVVVISRGARDGLERGHLLSVWQRGTPLNARAGSVEAQLPEERQAQLMVVRTHDRVAYALVMESRTTVQAGDRVTQP